MFSLFAIFILEVNIACINDKCFKGFKKWVIKNKILQDELYIWAGGTVSVQVTLVSSDNAAGK